MTLEEFREEVKRTMPDLGSELLNRIHMSMGMASELNEILDAIEINDKVNVSEELIDWCWYACNDLNLHNFHTPDHEFVNNESGMSNFNTLVKITSAIIDLDKKELVYNKPEDIAVRYNLLANGLTAIYNIGRYYNINLAEGRDKVIRKLRKRYPEKFDETLAKERNLEAERKELEN